MKQFIKRIVTALANLTFTLQGIKLPAYFDDSNRISLMLHGSELDVVNAARLFLKPGMVVVDIGANVGLMARAFARAVGPTGKVFSFEPDPATMEFLRHNVRSLPQVEPQAMAISNENTVARLHLHPRSGMSNSLVENAAARESVEVVCKTLDTFLAERGGITPDFIKIDVEGAEPRVFAGMKETLDRCPNVLIAVEFCPGNLANAHCSPQEFYQLLTRCGLKMAILQRNGPPTEVKDQDDLMQKLGTKEYVNLVCQRRQ